jgi:hypothetical protein
MLGLKHRIFDIAFRAEHGGAGDWRGISALVQIEAEIIFPLFLLGPLILDGGRISMLTVSEPSSIFQRAFVLVILIVVGIGGPIHRTIT